MAIDDDTVTPGELPAINEPAEWQEHLPAIITDVLIRGGANGEGVANFQARVLDARTRYLLARLLNLTSSGIILKGTLETQAELDAIPTENLQVGTAYFLDFALRAWNGTEWASSGSLQGSRGLILLGTWPNQLPLPNVSEQALGNTYTWNNDLWVVVPGATPEDPNKWESLQLRGKDGKSTYDIWKEIPGNENGSVNDFIIAQRGQPGLDAVAAWLARPGNEGKTQADYDEFYKGAPGETGPARAPFHIQGTLTNTSELPLPGVATEAYYIGIDMYVWVDSANNYVMIPGISGKSAYQIWLELPGNADKTEAEFLESLKGAPGQNSTVPGPAGRNLRILGTYPTSAEIISLPDPVDQDAYCALDTGRLWMYLPDEGGWKDLGPWRGVDGKSAFEIWLADGHEGSSLEDFWAFLKGADGRSLHIDGVVATLADLPPNPVTQLIYGVRDQSSIFVWLDGAWLDMGTFGKDGEDGKSAFEEWQADGHPGGTLEEFWASLKGKDGQSLDYIKVLTLEDPEPPEPTEANKGKAYISLDRMVFLNTSGSAWVDAGPFMPVGVGPAGAMWWPKGMVPTNADLPAEGEDGDTYVVVETGLTHVFNASTGVWSAGIDLSSKQPGPEGQPGAPGALMPIKGIYQTVAQLEADHPTGTLGDAYLIIDSAANPPVRDLAIWSDTASVWINTGPAGIPGAEGKPGKDSTVPGPQGIQGSRWLTLATHDAPSNTFVGREGDWAVNLDNKIFYKSPGGWIMWGTLVAGDVNSPLESQGKVVRYANTWVPVPVDEVTNPVAGKWYARQKDGSKTTTVWGALPDIITDLVTADGKQMCRKLAVGTTVPVWAEIVFPNPSHTDYPIVKLSTSGSFNPTVDQVLEIDNSAATAKTITLGDGPKGANARAMLCPIQILGKAGAVTFSATDTTVLEWDKATVPTIQNKLTILSLYWTGVQWVGSVGPKVP